MIKISNKMKQNIKIIDNCHSNLNSQYNIIIISLKLLK